MATKKTRKRAYIPPTHEVVNRRERSSSTPRPQRAGAQRGGRAAYEYPVPSMRRTLKRLPVYFILIFALQFWLSGQDSRNLDMQERVLFAAGSAAFVTVVFAPFMHVMDRFAYNRHLKRSGAAGTAAKSR